MILIPKTIYSLMNDPSPSLSAFRVRTTSDVFSSNVERQKHLLQKMSRSHSMTFLLATHMHHTRTVRILPELFPLNKCDDRNGAFHWSLSWLESRSEDHLWGMISIFIICRMPVRGPFLPRSLHRDALYCSLKQRINSWPPHLLFGFT